MRFVLLTNEERTLVQDRYKNSHNHVERMRCDFLLLSEKRLSMKEISLLKNVSWHTVSRFFNSWERADGVEEKIKCLTIKKGRGAGSKLEKFKDLTLDLIENNNRSIKTVLAILSESHGIKICRETLRNFLKQERIQIQKMQKITEKQKGSVLKCMMVCY